MDENKAGSPLDDLIETYNQTLADENKIDLLYLDDYLNWKEDQDSQRDVSENDDVTLRTYLLHLKIEGKSRIEQKQRIRALRRIYTWLHKRSFLQSNPFEEYDIERPYLPRDQIRKRSDMITGSRQDREISRLKLLNQLVERLNRSADSGSTLKTALETINNLLQLETGWSYLLPRKENDWGLSGKRQNNPYRLSAVSNIPPGLEANDRQILNQPEDCHCLHLLRTGRLNRAVNIVECTRLQQSREAEGENLGLKFHASVPLKIAGKPVGLINVAAQDWQLLTSADLQLLSAISGQVSAALERAMLFDRTEAHRARLEHEMDMAREVQRSLIPEQLPDISGFDLAAAWQAANEVAGDFFDVFSLRNGQWGIVVADVSDKGAPSALYMAMTRSLIRASAANHENPVDVFKEVNNRMNPNSFSGMFVTAFYAVIEPQSRKITSINAGHNPPVVRRANGSLVKLEPNGPALGIFDDPDYQDVNFELLPGDMLVVYTDGVTDALNQDGEVYGSARLHRWIQNSAGLSAKQALEKLQSELQEFTSETPQFDDITILMLTAF